MALIRPQVLIRDLRSQGLRVQDKKDGTGFTVMGKTDGTNPSGIVQVHTSSLSGERASVVAIIGELRKIGYNPDGSIRKLENLQEASYNLKKLTCGIDGCTKAALPGPLALHRKSKHKVWWAHEHPNERPKPDETTTIKPRGQTPVTIKHQEPTSEAEKAKQLIGRIQRNLSSLQEVLPEVVTLVGSLEQERNELKRKLDRVSKSLGAAVDAL